jgi:hypothetical protein
MRSFVALAAAVLFTLGGWAAAQDVHTDFDHKVDFSNYHTYSWVKVETDNPLWESRIKDDFDRALQERGWQRVDSGGQVALTAVGAVKNQQEYNTFYSGMGGWGWHGGYGGTTTTTVENVRVGAVMVSLSDDTKKNQSKLEKSVDKMMKDFPPKEK